jgi:DNA-binding NarL/FixJ family response regulator
VSIVGEAEDPEQALSIVENVHPDVVLVDAETPDLDCVSAVEGLVQSEASPRVVVLTVHSAAMREALAATPATVVGKTQGLATLMAAIHAGRPGPKA